MKPSFILSLVASPASCAFTKAAESSENKCVFSSVSDFLADEGARFPTHGMILNFSDSAGFTPYRAFIIKPCTPSAAFYCFSTDYLTFGMPKTPVLVGQSWVIESDSHTYEQDAEIEVLGHNEAIGVISRSAGGKLKSKIFVNDASGSARYYFLMIRGERTIRYIHRQMFVGHSQSV